MFARWTAAKPDSSDPGALCATLHLVDEEENAGATPRWIVVAAIGTVILPCLLGPALSRGDQSAPPPIPSQGPPSRFPSSTAAAPSPRPTSPASVRPAPEKPSPTRATPAPTNGARAQSALTRLGNLPIIDRHPTGIAYYRRDEFGSGWVDTDRNGCNQRDDVLRASATQVQVVRQGSCDHDVVAGTWSDPYTGRTMTFTDLKDQRQAQAIQIDHIVPLAEAWASGANAWDRNRRVGFANDLDNLIAVDGPTNASKGSNDPAAWRPRKQFQCTYAIRWIGVKASWSLGADTSEVAALKNMLSYC